MRVVHQPAKLAVHGLPAGVPGQRSAMSKVIVVLLR